MQKKTKKQILFLKLKAKFQPPKTKVNELVCPSLTHSVRGATVFFSSYFNKELNNMPLHNSFIL